MTYLQRYFYKTPPEKQDAGALAFWASLDHIATVAPSVTGSILQELRDQSSHLKLIASENYSSLAVQQAMGNLLTDKYAEGVSFHRFYAGCDNVDAIEAEAVQELKLLFNCEHAFVQPHSGSDANLIAYWAILANRVQEPMLEGRKLDELSVEEYDRIRRAMNDQKLMGMALGSGGHLTHGYRHNVSSKMMRSVTYGVDPESGFIDYDQLALEVKREKPDIFLAGYSAYPRLLDFARMREIADSVGATFMVDMAHFSGLVAGKALQGNFNPVPFADIITSTTHKTLRGPRGGIVLCKKELKEAVDKACPMVMGGPLPHVMAAKVVAFKEANSPDFALYASQVIANAQALASELTAQGATLLTGGTDNHLVIIDVRPFGLTGRQAETALRRAKLTANRNSVPQDPNGPWYTSGIRIGTPAVTTLGMGIEEMKVIGKIITDVLKSTKGEGKAKCETARGTIERAHKQIAELLSAFPLYPILDLEGSTEKAELTTS